MFAAHSRRPDPAAPPEFHALDEHLRAVAGLAAGFADEIGAGRWGALAGIWHDLGKYRPGFQRYVQAAGDPDAHIEGRSPGRDKTHSAAGALWAARYLVDRQGRSGEVIARVLQYLIAGHHAGLDDWEGALQARLSGVDAVAEFEEAVATASPAVLEPGIDLPPLASIPVDTKSGIPGSFALWVRMLFSCLVDADFLDTESFMDDGRSAGRGGFSTLLEMSGAFDRHVAARDADLAGRTLNATPVNLARSVVLAQCRSKAALAPGIFTLTVPTGGGKTLSSLAFALEHARVHGHKRIIYAIPYTSIIEQTTGIFRGIFGDDNVIEHHAGVDADPRSETHRSRLACENWDAPLVVTTNVQLFESLFARRTSRCRKLHNLIGSVIVLDEAQLLPVEFLQPIIDVLRLLVRDYRVTVVLCTATQPALTSRTSFDARRSFRGFDPATVMEIIDDPGALYRALERVTVHTPANASERVTWDDVAAGIAAREAVLAIVNRRADARELHRRVRSLCAERVWHLSALMCPSHRSEVIAEIRHALEARRASAGNSPPVRVVSTQLVEAGVDLDFPVVYRAAAGLDSVAQAAGRCNREGRLQSGDVYVFRPPSDPPPGLLRQAEAHCRAVWQAGAGDALRLELFDPYFRRLYGSADLDRAGICEMLRVDKGAVRFRSAAEAFRLIDDDGAQVVVKYRRTGSDSSDIDPLVKMLERDGPSRWLLRRLQRYSVTVYRRDLDRLLASRDVRELHGSPGLYLQVADTLYDPNLGLLVDGAPGDPGGLIF
ncbi:MAG: CRISPR-associated helicase Cas3' [Gammaproteobacteria bacterium]